VVFVKLLAELSANCAPDTLLINKTVEEVVVKGAVGVVKVDDVGLYIAALLTRTLLIYP